MNDEFPPSPFVPGDGHLPPELAGRGEETALLDDMLKRLKGEIVEGRLRIAAADPVRIIGPRGAGKTALLRWTKQQAEQRGILVVKCSFLFKGDANVDPLKHVLSSMQKGPSRLVKLLRKSGFMAPAIGGGLQIKMDSPGEDYMRVALAVLRESPLLLLLDEAHVFDPYPLAQMLNYNQELLSDGYPLGVVMAGPPKLASVLRATNAGFIDRCLKIRINTLSDAATRDALQKPFVRAGLRLAPDALELMAARCDNYPAFIQMMGDEIWNAMADRGRQDADAALVEQIEPTVRRWRQDVCEEVHERMRQAGLLPHARRVIEMIESNGGEIAEGRFFNHLTQTEGVDCGRAVEICGSLQEEGIIWTVEAMARPGIPSFFNYFKERDRIENPPKGGGFQLRNWLPNHVPWFTQRRKRG